MAVRRKPRAFRDGGRVSAGVTDETASAPRTDADAPASSEPADGIAKELAAIQRAERLQAEMAQRQAQPQGMTPRQQRFVAEHPVLMMPHVLPHARKAYADALAAGLHNDTDELENFILEKTTAKIREMARPNPERERLGRELKEAAGGGFQAAQEPQPETPAPTRQRSVPVSAPVARSAPSMGDGGNIPTRITLTPEERDMARRSYQNLPPEAAERLYSEMKRKMLIARANGTLSQ